MKRLNVALSAACLSLLALDVAGAQSDSLRWRPHELAVFGGVSRSARFDATASPRTFGGTASTLGLAYDRRVSDRLTLSLASGYVAGNLGSIDAGTPASEQQTGGNVRAAVLGQFGAATDRSRFALGLATSAEFAFTRHHYADPGTRISDFMLATWTVGPVARWDADVGRGRLRVEATSPVVGLAYHPYSDTRSMDPLARARFVGADQLRALNGSLTYTTATRRKYGIVYNYGFSLLHFADVQPVRAASQSFSVGIVRRFGPERP